MLKYQVEYEQISVEEYEQKYKEAQIKYMKKTCTEPVEVCDRQNEKRRPQFEDTLFWFNYLQEFE